jgi:hypothetical protein
MILTHILYELRQIPGVRFVAQETSRVPIGNTSALLLQSKRTCKQGMYECWYKKNKKPYTIPTQTI